MRSEAEWAGDARIYEITRDHLISSVRYLRVSIRSSPFRPSPHIRSSTSLPLTFFLIVRDSELIIVTIAGSIIHLQLKQNRSHCVVHSLVGHPSSPASRPHVRGHPQCAGHPGALHSNHASQGGGPLWPVDQDPRRQPWCKPSLYLHSSPGRVTHSYGRVVLDVIRKLLSVSSVPLTSLRCTPSPSTPTKIVSLLTVKRSKSFASVSY